MAKFTVVYFETIRLSLEVEAGTVEDAMAKADAAGGARCLEMEQETLGTDGVVEVLDADGNRIWLAGEKETPDGA